MSLDDLVTINVSSSAIVPTRAGFGTPLIMCGNLPAGLAVVSTYTSLASLATALSTGYATHPAYLMASSIMAQNPSVTRVKLGKRTTTFTQVIELTPVAPGATAGLVYSVTIDGTVCSYTSLVTDTADDVCDGLASQINGIAGTPVNAVVSPVHPNATKVVCTSAAAYKAHSYTARSTGLSAISLKDATAAGGAGLVTDLTTALNYDPDFYGILLDSSSYAEITGSTLSAWLSSNHKILCIQTSDNAVSDLTYTTPFTQDVASKLKSITDVRTFVIYSRDLNFIEAAAQLGKMLPTDPGSATWAFKTLTGVSPDAWTPTERTNAQSKNANTYMTTSGISITEPGKSAGGEWMDVTVFVDWLRARMQERVFYLLANRPKVPFTDAGIDALRSEILAQLMDGIAIGGLAASPAPVVTAPTAASIPSATKALRSLTGVTFSATLAGAIHQLTLTGTVSA